MKIASLEMTLVDPLQYNFKIDNNPNRRVSRDDWEVDYYLHTHLDGWILSWEVEIPPRGSFALRHQRAGWYRSGKQTFNIAAAFTPGRG